MSASNEDLCELLELAIAEDDGYIEELCQRAIAGDEGARRRCATVLGQKRVLYFCDECDEQVARPPGFCLAHPRARVSGIMVRQP